MRAVAHKSIAVASAIGIAGVSSLFFGAAPASATPTCANGGTLVTGTNICELTILAGSSTTTFAATPDMTRLQVLLVGGGGDGNYGHGGGGGGAVKIVDFDGGAAPTLSFTAGYDVDPSTVTVGSTTVTAAAGTSDIAPTTKTVKGKTVPVNGISGVSGSGKKGYKEGSIGYGGGGGAKASPSKRRNGGAGVAADKVSYKSLSGKTLSPTYRLFAGDTTCYGGGGAVGDGTHDGIPGCGGGSVATGGAVTPPTENTGGGAGALVTTTGEQTGANGVIVIRWNATPPVTLSFNDGKRGHNPKSEHLFAGDTPKQPSSPKVSHYKFLGWYTDAAFTTAADFTQPVNATETFYGKFKKR